MNLAEQAFKELFPEKKLDRKLSVEYSGRFKNYNANVKYTRQYLIFSLSKEWKDVSEEIQIGLIQTLLLRVYKVKKDSLNIDLYESFLKNLTKISVPRNIDPELKIVFDKMNELYFHNYMDMPNLIWGKESFSKLGSYEYAIDTITISTILRGEEELLDYVMYHEMLHKEIQFHRKNGRSFHHTPEFRRREKLFYIPDIERKLTAYLRKKRLKKAFRWF